VELIEEELMTIQNLLLGLLAETFVHPGSGQSESAIDLPVAREAATDYPFIAGSSLKGALLDCARQQKWDDATRNSVFGERESAGNLLVSDARLLLLPVRSLTDSYKWATCPHLLERFSRDFKRGLARNLISIEGPDRKHYRGDGEAGTALYLEERTFKCTGSAPNDLIKVIADLVVHQETQQRLIKQLVILNDDDFVWFARYGLAVQARNVLDEKTKTSGNVWYEETLPPDTLMYALLSERGADAVNAVTNLFDERPYLQAGGNETVGQGWFAVKCLTSEKTK
jgi:CRISPR-associated protein Cmr4